MLKSRKIVQTLHMTAGAVHRDIELSKDTEVKLYSQDVAKASDEVCQQCYDSECNAAEVSCPSLSCICSKP